MLKELNNNAGAVQAIATVILVIITIWYAFATSSMQKVMKEEFKLSSMPYVGIDNYLEYYRYKTDTHFEFKIINLGKVAVSYVHNSIMFGDINITPPDKNEVVLYPGQSILLRSNSFKVSDFSKIKNQPIIVKINYRALNTNDRMRFFKRSLTIYEITNDANFKWKLIDGDSVGIEK